MPRNKSEKRSPVDQVVFDYIKAWVEYSCTKEGALKEGVSNGRFANRDGSDMWENMSDLERHSCRNVVHGTRWEWLRAQKQK